MLANTREHWGSVAKALHWTIAALILLEIPAGYLMTYTYGLAYRDSSALPLHNLFSQIHHTNGLLILLLVVARLIWRSTQPRPASGPDRFPLQHGVSATTHLALYSLLIVLPLSGWAALSVFGKAPIWFFGLRGVVPSILPVQPLKSTFGYGAFAHLHLYALWAGGVFLSLHALAALWHHLVLKDDVLARMWPLGRVRDQPPAVS